MKQETVETKKGHKEIEDIIANAMKKIGAKDEHKLIRYLPGPGGGYMHHFTLKKMKKRAPQELAEMIEKHILKAAHPSPLPFKPRAPRGSRKTSDRLSFSRGQLERMLSIARLAGDKDMVALLSPRRPLAACKRELIASIRENRVEQELWNAYIEAVNASQNQQQSTQI